MSKTLTNALLLGAFALPCAPLAAESLGNLDDISLESLGNIVTSVSKKPEDSFRSAAAIHVITNEDIKLSGATHIAEVLRGVPGLNVARYDSSNWAITSRGFNGFYSNKLLVLVDGRTIYTPLFSGVYWDIQNIPLGDVERIEIIRGPGASLWGANAVNGIINIITKSAADTQGAYLNQVVGNQDRSLTDLRYGGKIGEDFYYRTYAKYENRNQTHAVSQQDGNNEWDNAKVGFRSDWNTNGSRKITIQGDAYDADINLDLSTPSLTSLSGYDFSHDKINSKGMNLLGRWEEKHSDDLRSTFQSYFDYQSPDYSSLQQDIYTFDLDYQTAWKANERNDLMWGFSGRYISADLEGSSHIQIAGDTTKTQGIISAFLQNQFAIIPKEIYLTLGSKFENNSLVGFEIEPSARIAWYPDNQQTLWAAVSRAVRTPSIGENNLTVDALSVVPGVVAQSQYNKGFASEDLIAYEMGYRVKPDQQLSIDSTAFIHSYTNLGTYEPLAPIAVPNGFYYPFAISNLGAGHAYGFETSAKWEVTSRWNLLANYSYINLLLDQGSSLDPTFASQRGRAPHNQFMLRSQLYLPHDTHLINTAYYVDDLPADAIEDYVRFDTQVIWQAASGIELALIGQNLLDNRHPEFAAPPEGYANQIPRAFYGRVTLRY